MLRPLTLALALVANPLTAETDLCKSLGDLAETVMSLRQQGTEMSSMMAISEEPFVREMILIAYDQPRFSSAEYQERATRDFRNEVEAGCYEATRR